MRQAESALAGIAIAVLAYGLAMALLLPAPFTRELSARTSQLPPDQAAELSESARRLVVYGDDDARDELAGVMTADAISHLDDVRRVIGASIWTTAALLVGVLGWAVLRYRAGHGARVASALRLGAVISAASVLLVGTLAVVDFDAFFSAFHALFFEPGTWQFPSDSVLIRLFPEGFWVTAAVVWAALILLAAVACGVAARLIEASAAARTAGR
jgi:integral membrane protein (TIGR01906 family)